ncbi:MCE family protein [Actinomadura montaniterrae]|uniref:MCE family protein n=1 Tax=Actinomadura montaniterrae TaxID=1803903 RepID=A0A6L3VT91_9ACTN|nr:MCE family protein [Actinomadura montaniterrae]KAB2375046.1 MCE family protein [Actinomadura montaniterrae]
MTRRIRVNLAVFALLGVVLTVWAVRNVLGFDPFSRPYRISAQFTDSRGLQPGFDVTYLGVAIGKIQSVRLDGGKVVVRLAIDKGRRVPQGVTATAALKSAIGEPYVDLEPAGGRAGAPPMRPGDVIPLSRTSVSESYGDLFASVTKAVNGLDPANLRIVTRELARGLDGRGDTLRLSVDGASQLARTFASNTTTLDSLITNLGALTGVLAGKRADLAAGITATADITSSLAEVDDSLVRIRDTTPDLLARTAKVLRESRPAAQCMLGALSDALPALLTPANVSDLSRGLQWSPQLASAMRGVITFVNGQPNLNIKFILTLTPEKGAVEYRNLTPLPSIPRIPACPGVDLPAQQSPPLKKAETAAKGGSATGTATTATAVPAGNAAGTAPEHHGPPAWLIYLPPLLAGLVLLRVVMSMLGAAWRPISRRRSR